MKNQAINPFLPLKYCIPDGEPHVFGDRVYLFGSHDVEGGERYCQGGDYLCFSAPVDDLSAWRCDGVIYESSQDPDAKEGCEDLYAPDVVRGNDGRYYLYYTLSGDNGAGFSTPISVAVCDTPSGKYRYLGKVRNPDGTPFLKYITADPALLNDDGTIRLYYGWSLSLVCGAANSGGVPDREPKLVPKNYLRPVEKMLFKRSDEELDALEHDVMGAFEVELCDDMLTVKSQPMPIAPGQFSCLGTSFEYHAFYEAASCRKIGNKYYFIYSSQESNELCYATSDYPDRDFVYGGTIISNGDVGYMGRLPEDRLNMTANNHGSLEEINGQWYIFYHRQTHSSTFSRQACAEPVTINPDGSIDQVECTTQGMNLKPLEAAGEYSAAYCCNLTNGKMPHITNRKIDADIPYISNDGDERFVKNMGDGSTMTFKYFKFEKETDLIIKYRGDEGALEVILGNERVGEVNLTKCDSWQKAKLKLKAAGEKSLTLKYLGNGKIDVLSILFE